ncbi:hypothetical protein BUALT_Bualt09G0049300 [Buddleja alternifolia]|uniref:Protein kinase domain-containing protein n=1 Tax=Buddleja alternifolia TaxID=168488 RepID=A0AAV6X199_9LAMI|nr:hypothetical protein BUALT_Bualt09G0049300 [Buddleja alternifolia]
MSELIEFEYKDLETLTDNFSEENFIYHAQYCKLYRGKIPKGWKGMECRVVTVKVWVDEAFVFPPQAYKRSWEKNLENFRDEIMILEHRSTMLSPNLPKLMGFFHEDTTQRLGVVYDLESIDVLENLFDKERFGWHNRIKVALGLAKILEHFHGNQPRYLIRDFSTAHIMLDKDFNAVLFNFFGFTGGVLGEKIKGQDIMSRKVLGSLRYVDLWIFNSETWKESMDVYSFGIILLELIRKRKVCTLAEPKTTSFEYEGHLQKMYKRRKSKLLGESRCSLVDQRFEIDESFHVSDGCRISKLAMECVRYRDECLNAKEIVEKLNKMRIVKKPPSSRRLVVPRKRHCGWMVSFRFFGW